MLRNKYAILGIGLGVQSSRSLLLHLFPLIFPSNYLLIWPSSFSMILPITQSSQSSFISLLTDGQQKVFSLKWEKPQPDNKEGTDSYFLIHNNFTGFSPTE